jgi:acetyl esterase
LYLRPAVADCGLPDRPRKEIRVPLDPQSRTILDLMAQMNIPDFSTLSPEDARKLFDQMPRPQPPTPVTGVEDRAVPGPGGEIPVRIYTFDAATPGAGLVYFHGGGWVIGDLESHDETCRLLAARSGAVVVATQYRLAPETRFPGAAEDCYATARWVSENAASLGIDPGRLAIGGDSAGGNLTAVVAQMARDRGGPSLRFQLLIYPVTDCDFETASYSENADGYFLTRRSMQWFWDHYVPDPADRVHAYASPLRAKSLSELPPALVITAEYDPLRDEGEAYAKALEEAGVTVKCSRYDGMLHGFFGFTRLVDQAERAVDEAAEALQRELA